jgi:hypothetical protein
MAYPKAPWIFVAVAVLGYLWHNRTPSIETSADLVSGQPIDCSLPRALEGHSPAANSEPLQTDVDGRLRPFHLGDAKVTPLAGFSIKSVVLARRIHRSDPLSKYSPVDLGLGWGIMANPDLYKRLNMGHDDRWLHIRPGGWKPPYSWGEISKKFGNAHLIPATKEIRDSLMKVTLDQEVQLDGWLVRIDTPKFSAQSSLTRDDTGGGACEIMYVCRVQ